MKKKGLLISTIVMVVVLVASLTTATYAWFSATATVSIDTISLVTSAADGLVIGAKSNAAGTQYSNGELTWNAAGYWEDGTEGLGSSVSFNAANGTKLAVKIDKACAPYDYASGAELAAYSSESGTFTSGSFVSAEAGATSTQYNTDSGTITKSEPNVKSTSGGDDANVAGDYIDLDLAVAAAAENKVEQAICKINIKPTDTTSFGMAAALHIYVEIDGVAKTATLVNDGLDVFGTNQYSDSFPSSNNSTTGLTYGYINQDGSVDLYYEVFTSSTTKMSTQYSGSTRIYPYTVRIICWIDGFDSDCINENTGTGAEVSIKFGYTADATKKVTVDANNRIATSDLSNITF